MIIQIFNFRHFYRKILGAVIFGIIIFFLLIGFIEKDEIVKQTNANNEYGEVYTDLIAQYETQYNEYNLNRCENIKIAIQKVDGTIVMPNEIFSFNDVVGPRTEENGFKLATVYQNGKVIEGFGGGVCQVSSTLYNAIICANLQVIERKNHLFLPAYIHSGGDATVADGYVDFKFKNTRKEPIKIKCNLANGRLNVKLYGKKQEDDCVVEVKTKDIDVIPYNVIYEKDEEINLGEEQIVQKRKKWI